MKFTLSWLKEFIDTTASLDEIAAKLTAVGLEVENIHDPAKTMAGFVVGHVVSAEKHPDADKLQCLVVDTGKEQLAVVCGAPNARAGMKGVFAPPGSYIPGLDVTLKKAQIRGQESNGMMCSERELELSDEHKGIIELPDDLETGSPAAKALGLDDPVIEINLTPNRGDCAAILGIARDLAAAGLGTLKPLPLEPVDGLFKNPVSIDLKDAEACPLFIGRYIKGVKNGPSPKWLADRLKAIGLRPISALVDITNYMTIACGRPLHVFDADKLKGNIHVRLSKKGEKLEALNDKSYDLEDGMTVVCDDTGVLGLGGIIGGVPSSVSEETTNVYLEVAYFDPVRTAKTGQKLQIDSEARYRFERGVDPEFAAPGTEIATRMILDICGGQPSEPFTAGAPPKTGRTVDYTTGRLRSLGGMGLPAETQKTILTALGFKVEEGSKKWIVTAPGWRSDIDGSADIVEEVLRIAGYDKIPTLYVRPTPEERHDGLAPLLKRQYNARWALASRGMHETVTWSFMDDVASDLFGAQHHQNKKALTLTNPISVELSVMRPSILPNLIAAAGRNTDRGYPDACLFEIGNCYKATDAEGQIMMAAGIRSGHAIKRHWAQTARAVDAFDAKADAMAVLESCGVSAANLQVSTDAPEWYHPGRSGALRLGPNVLAWFGEMHPGVLDSMKRDEKFAGFEVFLQNIPESKKKGSRKELLRPSPLQPLSRDFAFLLDEKVEAEKVVRAIKGADKALVTHVEIFDVYTGKGVDPGKKSVAVGVTIQPVEKTLTDEEITALSKKITDSVIKQTGGALRS